MDIFGNFSQLFGDKKKRSYHKAEEFDYSYTDPSLDGIGKIESKDQPVSIFSIKALIVLVFCVLVFRLFVLQVVEGQANQNLADVNRMKPRTIEAQRGVIMDSEGVWLARNKPSFILALYPSELPRKKVEREAVYQQISEISKVSVEDIKKSAEKNGLLNFDYVALGQSLSHDDSLLLSKKIAGIPGLTVMNQASREYAMMPGLAHILGYTGRLSQTDLDKNKDSGYLMADRIGKTGVESEYESFLRGIHGEEQIEIDSKYHIVRVLAQEGRQEPVSGQNLTLYLDRGLQQKTAEILQNAIASAKVATGDEGVIAGTVAVMDVKTGGILAMVSLPDYDNNLFSTSISTENYQKLMNDAGKPMLNRAIAGIYPPGSIAKIIMASAGLQEGTITANTSLVTPATIKIGDYNFPDWKDHSYESTDVKRAIAESNNIFFYALGGGYDKIKGLGIDKIKQYWKLFGLGEETGIDIPGESSGLLPDETWKKKAVGEPWYLGDTYHVSIGQGDMLVTPIQMLRATAVFANRGKLLQPQLVKKITDDEGNVVKEFGPRVERENFVDSSVIETVRQGMRMTVTDGSAKNMADLPVTVAGKTGTAQFLNNQKTHAWFECFAPYENPEIAVIAMVEGGGGSYEVANPIAKEVLAYYFGRKGQ